MTPEQLRFMSQLLMEYRHMSTSEVLAIVLPIIQSYRRKTLVRLTGIGINTIYSYCKTTNPARPTFENYVALLVIGQSVQRCEAMQKSDQEEIEVKI